MLEVFIDIYVAVNVGSSYSQFLCYVLKTLPSIDSRSQNLSNTVYTMIPDFMRTVCDVDITVEAEKSEVSTA